MNMAKQIPLTRGKVAIVDDKDFEELSKQKWHYRHMRHTHKNKKGYAARSVGPCHESYEGFA